MKLLLAAALVLLLGIASPADAETPIDRNEEATAQKMFQTAGVQGGLVVHVDCGDGRLTAALGAADGFLVHGLDKDAENVAAARKYIQSLATYGKISVDLYDGLDLPYIDNTVNLLVINGPSPIARAEILRVLCPGGVAYLNGEAAELVRKPWPDNIDQWTHFLHDADNNAVAHDDVVASPRHVQWVGQSKWARHHNHLASMSAMVSAGGRLFQIVDEGSVASINLPSRWFLVARDAFNGVLLWKEPIGPWEGQLRPFRSGPPELSRRLVAVGDRVFVTLGYGKPLCCLDAATGKLLRTYDQTEGAVEVVCCDGVLYVVVGQLDQEAYAAALRRGSASPPTRGKRIHAIDTETGRTLWVKQDADTSELFPTTLCVAGGRVLFHSTSHVVCLETPTGKEIWRAERPGRTDRLGWSTPTLVAQQDVVLCADCASPQVDDAEDVSSVRVQWGASASPKRGNDSLGQLIAFSAVDGRRLWSCATAQGYNAPPDLFVADNLVWTSTVPNLTSEDFTEGRDLQTGKVLRRLETASAFTTTHHHRCYRNKATDRFILLGRTGTELIDLAGDKPLRHCWFRGTCQYGVMPCNGLIYSPPHSCACYIQSKLSGFWALAPERGVSNGRNVEESESHGERGDGDEWRLLHGPAYGTVQSEPEAQDPQLAWPTYRHDSGRSGWTKSRVSLPLTSQWKTAIGGRVTAPVIADGKLLVASIDTHTVHALNAVDGSAAWSYTAGGRVDSPPTIHEGLVLFGSADGYVTCLRLDDGALVWRFCAAPLDQRMVAFEQVESVWPVTGSVLVRDDVVYCTAGRSSYLDGGMVLWRLEPGTGRPLGRRQFYDRDPETGRQPEELIEDVEMPGALPDVLSCDGQNVFWRDKRLDMNGRPLEPNVPHLYSSVGFLDDHWWHRTYWIFGTKTYGRASGWAVVGNYVPSGRIMVQDDSTVFGYGRQRIGGGDRGLSDVALHLFRADQQVTPLLGRRGLKNNNLAIAEHFQPTKVHYHWAQEVPLYARAMALADGTLFVAGPVAGAEGAAGEPTFGAQDDAVLAAFDSSDGEQLFHCELDAGPVFDGMAAAYGRLYLSTVDGGVTCLGGE